MISRLMTNLRKLRASLTVLRIGMERHVVRFIKEPSLHTYVNLWVEAHRLTPYLTGHVDAIAYPILIAWLAYSLVFG